MKTITFQIHNGDSFISKQIKRFSLGEVSHASVDFEGVTYESIEGEGTRKLRTIAYSYSPIVERYEIKVSDRQYDQLLAWMESQLGKKYDYTGVFAHVFPIFLKPKMGKWYCSELTFVLRQKIARVLGDDSANNKVSPQLFRDILRGDKAYKRV